MYITDDTESGVQCPQLNRVWKDFLLGSCSELLMRKRAVKTRVMEVGTEGGFRVSMGVCTTGDRAKVKES